MGEPQVEQKVVKFEIGKVLAIVIAVAVVAGLASVFLTSDYYKGLIGADKEKIEQLEDGALTADEENAVKDCGTLTRDEVKLMMDREGLTEDEYSLLKGCYNKLLMESLSEADDTATVNEPAVINPELKDNTNTATVNEPAVINPELKDNTNTATVNEPAVINPDLKDSASTATVNEPAVIKPPTEESVDIKK